MSSKKDFGPVLPGDQYTGLELDIGEEKRVCLIHHSRRLGMITCGAATPGVDFAGPSLSVEIGERVIRRASEVDTPHVHKCIYEC